MDAGTTDSAAARRTPSIDEQKVARVYAEAVLDAAAAAGRADEVMGELRQLVTEVFPAAPELEQMLASDALGEWEKEAVLRKAFEHRSTETFFHFLLVLNKHGRLGLLRAVHAAVVDLDNRRRRRLPVKVRVAAPLADDQRHRLLDQLRAGFGLEPILDVVVDPDILGGLIVQVEDLVFDASVRSELNNIKKHLIARGNHVVNA